MKKSNTRKRDYKEDIADDSIPSKRRCKRRQKVWVSVQTFSLQDIADEQNQLQDTATNESQSNEIGSVAQVRKATRSLKNGAKRSTAFSDSPLDIFLDIAFYLPPRDLLSLSRVSRQLRKLILSKSNRDLWKNSLRLVNLPRCPGDLSEPQYASLVFDTDCNVCGARHTKSVYYELRKRLCDACYETSVSMMYDIIKKFNFNLKYTHTMNNILPYVGRNSTYFTISAGSNKYYTPDLVHALEKYVSLSANQKALKDYLERCRQRSYRIVKHVELMLKWENLREGIRKTELSDRASLHEKNVKWRLRELGYADEDWTFKPSEYESNKQWNKLACQKRELTTRTWKTMLPKLEKLFLEKQKSRRYNERKSEFLGNYQDYIDTINMTFGELRLMPSALDVISIQEVKDLIEHDDSRQAITSEVWSAFLPTLVRICREYKPQMLTKHENALIKSRTTNEVEIQDIGELQHILLASSFFKEPFTGYFTELYYFTSPHSAVTSLLGAVPFENRHTGANNINLNIPDALLINLGFPRSITMSTVQAKGKCFMCCRCNEIYQERMTWIELVKHYVEEIDLPNKPKIIRLERQRSKPANKECDHSLKSDGDLARMLDDNEVTTVVEGQSAPVNPDD